MLASFDLGDMFTHNLFAVSNLPVYLLYERSYLVAYTVSYRERNDFCGFATSAVSSDSSTDKFNMDS